MKILELRFKNLNSLRGEWLIDFSHPDYVSNGIFAITGPTGSGKSTILDAICLALYGATPRLGRITAGSNEIMSRQTGECYAEVVFQSQGGCFRCHWEQRRARKRAEGKLQDQEHWIADEHIQPSKLIETMKSRIVGVIEEKTGMDFERFSRSILLAQGGFDTFLKAGVEQKSKILEQMTGTRIYSMISTRVHERTSAEQKKIDILKAEIAAIGVLDPEQQQALQQELHIQQQQQHELNQQLKQLSSQITWLEQIEDLQQQVQQFDQQVQQCQQQYEQLQPKRVTLQQANLAASLEGQYAHLCSLRSQQQEDQQQLQNIHSELPQLKKTAQEGEHKLKQARHRLSQRQQQFETAQPLILKVRSLDQSIAQYHQQRLTINEHCAKQRKIINTNTQQQGEENRKKQTVIKKQQQTQNYLKEHAADEWLVSGLTGIEQQFSEIRERQQHINQNQESQTTAQKTLYQCKQQLDSTKQQRQRHQQKSAQTQQAIETVNNELSSLLAGKLLREYRAEKDGLMRELMLRQTISELEEHRARLEDGKPCPLCGAEEHPFALGNAPQADDIEQHIHQLNQRLDQAEQKEQMLNKLRSSQQQAQQRLQAFELQENQATNNQQAAEKHLEELRQTEHELRQDCQQRLQKIVKTLQPLGIQALDTTALDAQFQSLQQRLQQWQQQQQQQLDFAKQLEVIDKEAKRLQAIIDTQVESLTQQQKQQQGLQEELTAIQKQRQELFADKNADDEEATLIEAIKQAEQTQQIAADKHNQQQQRLTNMHSQMEMLSERMDARSTQQQQAENAFLSAIEAIQENAHFNDEESFKQARLSHDERQTLHYTIQQFDQQYTEIKAKQQDRANRLAATKAQEITAQSLSQLRPLQQQCQQTLQQRQEQITLSAQRLRDNDDALQRVQAKQAQFSAQQKECRRWQRLHDLIGSADGKKFRNFAQGLTFELVVQYANQQLQKMTDRYLLMRDEHQPLSLSVVDAYQAGEIRPTTNLSGGESFIISLTLALGLSNMSSRQVRVDSLFMDEGFGTLDELALETALATLSNLNQQGKLIGVISHVPELKQRISTQIKVTPKHSGQSTITGAGCEQLSTT